jgi:flagellar biosynthesis protein FlhB
VVELLKSMAKVIVLGGIGWWLLAGEIRGITTYGSLDVGPAIRAVGRTFVFAVLIMALALVLIGGVDVPAQIMQRAGRLRMTKQEVKDENKQSEGSPEMKGALRQRRADVLRGSARIAVTRRRSCSPTRPISRSRCAIAPARMRPRWWSPRRAATPPPLSGSSPRRRRCRC